MVRLLTSSATPPPAPIDRPRSAGESAAVRPADLAAVLLDSHDRPWSDRQVRRLLIAALALQVGSGIAMVLLPWLLLAAGGGAMSSAGGFLSTYLVYLVAGYPIALAAERRGARFAACAGGLVGLVGALALAVSLAASAPPLAIVAGGIWLGLARPCADGALYAALARHDDEDFVDAGSFIGSLLVLGRIGGPALAAAGWAVGGGGGAIGALMLAFALALAAAGPGSARRPLIEASGSLGDGLRHIASRARRAVLANTAWNVLLGGGSLALLAPHLAALGGDPASGTAVVLAGNLAALAASLAARGLLGRYGPEPLLRWTLPASGLGLGLLALAPDVPSAALAFALGYLPNQLWISAVLVAVGQQAPAAIRPSVAAGARIAVFGGLVAGALPAGLLAERLGTGPVMALCAAGAALLGAAWLATEPTRPPR